MHNILAKVLMHTCARLEEDGYSLPADLKAWAIYGHIPISIVRLIHDDIPDEATKTEAHYDQAMRSAVRAFYRGEIDGFGFIDKMVNLITEQFTRAWNEGMRNIGLDPQEDMEDEWRAVLEDRIAEEIDAVQNFAADIEAAAADRERHPMEPLLSRVSMWSNRYNEIVSLSQATCGQEKLEWVFGDTEHCDDCLKLNGCVDYSNNWIESGWLPQTDKLKCGGFHCQCELKPTKRRRTKGGVAGRMG